MKIALPTNDKMTIAPRTGQSKFFAVYSVNDKHISEPEFRENPHSHEHGHGTHKHGEGEGEHEHSHKEILDLLKDCNLVIVKHIGKYMKNDFDSVGLDFKKTKSDELADIIRVYSK